ncbi:MFS transporter [Brevibacillus sp. B_LB10_24]|uniref:MFS transporter n=1 Tax=Brevibacillus sp. B_LB10_24 TaxID=3380645 RepID=UPI0038BC40A2
MKLAMKTGNRKQVVVISLLTAACLLGDSMLYIALPIHWAETGLDSLWQVGLLLSVNRIVRLPLNPLIAWVYQRLHIRAAMLIAVLLAIVTTAGYGLCYGFLAWLALRCLWGVAWSLLRMGAQFAILDVSDDDNRGYYMGTYNGLYRLGSLLGMLAGGVVADSWGLQSVALLFAGVTAAALPFLFRFVPKGNTNYQSADLSTAAAASPWRDRQVLWTMATGLYISMLYSGVFTSTVSYLVARQYAENVTLLGITIGAASIAGTLQALRWTWEPWLAPLIGRISDGRGNRSRFLGGTLVSAAVFFALIPVHMPLGVWILLLIGVQLTATALTTLSDTLAADRAAQSPPAKVAIVTLYTISIDTGAAIGPMFAYFMNSAAGMSVVYLGGALLLLAFAAKWLLPAKVEETARY